MERSSVFPAMTSIPAAGDRSELFFRCFAGSEKRQVRRKNALSIKEGKILDMQ
jgi:hypothetical protein